MSRVCLVHMGGTIAMEHSSKGYVPAQGYIETYLGSMAELSTPVLPPWDFVRLDPIKDSADFTPRDWVRLAEAIETRAADYDGFVVLHGTDTMAYTASALSYLLSGVHKPIVLTGAQLPLSDIRSDGRQHLITSLILAGRYRIPEGCIYFGDRLYRGNRAQKVHNQSFVAFASGNYPALASIGVTIDVRHDLLLEPRPSPIAVQRLTRHPQVATVQVHPGMSSEILVKLLEPPVEGMVLQTYGAGTFPTSDKTLLRAIEAAVERDVVVVNCSQCHAGRVVQDLYGTGAALRDVGVISGHDMTQEAVLTKLYCLLASGHSAAETRTRIEEDLAGELTRTTEGPR